MQSSCPLEVAGREFKVRLVSVAACISLASFSCVGVGSIGFNPGWDCEREASKGSMFISM